MEAHRSGIYRRLKHGPTLNYDMFVAKSVVYNHQMAKRIAMRFGI